MGAGLYGGGALWGPLQSVAPGAPMSLAAPGTVRLMVSVLFHKEPLDIQSLQVRPYTSYVTRKFL